MFPRIKLENTANKQIAIKAYLVRNTKLELDKEKCRSCGICFTVCPNQVIKRGAPGASLKKVEDDKMSGIVLDPDACSYCGLCAHMCPFDALTLYIDDEKITDDKLKLVENHAIPRLDAEEVTLKDGKTAKKYIEGHIEYYEDICESGCRVCINACPTDTRKFEKRAGWEIGEKFVIDRDTCIYCGACAFSCPTGAIKIFRDKIKVKPDEKFLEPFWPNTVKKLLDFHGIN
ncbi:MAG: 4Fe-4S binding protein [Promethearchaeota archaeon]